jgi:biotin carboxyl carrier protein
MVDIEEIEKLINLMKATRVLEISVESNGAKILLRRSMVEAEPVSQLAPVPEEIPGPMIRIEDIQVQAKATSTPIVAPLVGVFHNGGMTDRRIVIHEGDRVKEGQVIAVIEAMKVPNELRAPMDGVVSQILVEDGMGVEFGQTLLLIEPEDPSLNSPV